MNLEQSPSVEAVLPAPHAQPGYVTSIALTAALAGFIFGFDTVVISGANLPIKQLWHTSPWFHGFFIMSMALWGTVVGAIFGGLPTQKYGRKKVLFWIGVLFSISAIGSAIAQDPYTFSFFRFIGGLGIGVSSVRNLSKTSFDSKRPRGVNRRLPAFSSSSPAAIISAMAAL